MIDLWKKLFGTPPAAEAGPVMFDDHHLAAAALLVEAALMDGTLDEIEHARITDIIRTRLGVDGKAATALLEHAETAASESVDWHGFTRTIKETFDHDERIALVEMLWEVVYADGQVHDHEASLMRRVTGLLYVSGRESADARARAVERLAGSGG